jgi:hypothetical protein
LLEFGASQEFVGGGEAEHAAPHVKGRVSRVVGSEHGVCEEVFSGLFVAREIGHSD